MNLRNKFFILLTIGVFLTGQWGCATGPYGYPKPEPLLEQYREQLGTIGVTTGKAVPVIELDTPAPVPFPTSTTGILERTGQGASDGAEKTGGWMWDVCKEGWTADFGKIGGLGEVLFVLAGLTTWCILALPVGILGGIGGFFYGALPTDESPEYPANVEETEETEAILRYTVSNYPIQESFQNSFLKEARAQTSHTFVVSPKEGSQTSEGMGGQGVDTVLELSVERIWLKRVGDQKPELNPPMMLVLFVRARLVRGPEKTIWYDQTFVHETHSHHYQVWPYYYRVQTAIEKAYQSLAEQMVEKLFFTTQTSPQ